MEFFGTYRLSRPPLVRDDYDPDLTAAPTTFRARLSDAMVLITALVGLLLSLSAINDDAPRAKIALGVGVILLGASVSQLGVFLPEARAAWVRGARGGILVLAAAGVLGIGLLAWGLTA